MCISEFTRNGTQHVHAQPLKFVLMSCNIQTEIWAVIVKYIYEQPQYNTINTAASTL